MPRVSDTYAPPAGTKATSGTTIQSAPYNAFVDDLTQDANLPRPLTAGGTGATTPSGARTNLGAAGLVDANTFTATQTFKATDNATTTYPLRIQNAAGTQTADLGAYGLLSSGNYAVSFTGALSLGANHSIASAGGKQTFKASDNSTTTYGFRAENQAGNAGWDFGAYQFNHAAAGAAFTFNTSGHFVFTPTNGAVFGATAPYASAGQIHAAVASASSAAIVTESTGTSAARQHIINRNSNGAVFAISTSGTGGSAATISDETLKDFYAQYDFDDAAAIIQADPVRRYRWRVDGSEAVGWGAQTSYQVSPDLAVPGGWFDEETGEATTSDAPGAIYMRWMMDKTTRTPYLWAAVSGLISRVSTLIADMTSQQIKHGQLKARVEAVEARLSALEGPQA